MIVQKTAFEIYLDFIEKTLGYRKGYTQVQRRKIIQSFSALGCTDLENLRDRLQDVLKTGERLSDFSVEDTKQMLSAVLEKVDKRRLEKTHKKFRKDLIVIPEYLHQQVFGLTEVMTEFKDKYPETVNFENFGWALKRFTKGFIGRFLRD